MKERLSFFQLPDFCEFADNEVQIVFVKSVLEGETMAQIRFPMCRTSWNHSCTTERLGSLYLPGKTRIEIRHLAECDERRKLLNTQVERGARA